ncbi:hypothetical protein MXB_502 [Myxobolus squamalis]|nr:hypothetical protein MXB_502 [Myxobolus squamalis]
MPVHAQAGTLNFLSFQGRIGVKPTTKTLNILPLGTPNLKGIDSQIYCSLQTTWIHLFSNDEWL